MNDIEKLMAIESIKQLKARYFRFVDTKDWEGFASVYAKDGVFDFTDDVPDGLAKGVDAIVETASTLLEGCVSIHHGHCPEIEILSPETARGIWAMQDILQWKGDSLSAGTNFQAWGHYHETYEKIDGEWRIKTSKLTRLRKDFQKQ